MFFLGIDSPPRTDVEFGLAQHLSDMLFDTKSLHQVTGHASIPVK